jgi:hypothetical protein
MQTSTTATPTASSAGFFPVPELTTWKCNGGISPMIRNWETLARVAGAELPEAIRWMAIELHTYKLPGLPASLALVMEKGGTWGPSPEEMRLTAHAFFSDRATSIWWKHAPLLSNPDIYTTAQFLAKHGGTNSRAQCADLADLCRCYEIQGSYNDLDAHVLIAELKKFNKARFYQVHNPNTGKDAFEYLYGWEGSSVLYISAPMLYPLRVLSADWKNWFELGPDELGVMVQTLARRTKADECGKSEDRKEWQQWRLWWD